MYFLRPLLFVRSLGPLSRGEEEELVLTTFCVVHIPTGLVGTLVFPILESESRVQIIYTSCCRQNHQILTQNIAFLIANEEIIRGK